MTLAEGRAALHAVLQRSAHPHDTYIGLNAIGNEETVPLLLERFRQDAGTAGPPAPVEVRPPLPPDDNPLRFMSGLFVQRMTSVAAFSCVHHHLVEALANTTNTNRGLSSIRPGRRGGARTPGSPATSGWRRALPTPGCTSRIRSTSDSRLS